MFKRLLTEPLFHFLIAAVLLFLFLTDDGSNSESNLIRVTETKIQSIKQGWQQQWGRAPNAEELKGLISNAIDSEVYYREALRLGLDRDDAVVKNRLIQKIEYLQNESIAEPTEVQLRGWLSDNEAKYPDRKIYSFRQIYLGTDVAKERAEMIVVGLNENEINATDVEISLQVPKRMQKADSAQVSRKFGRDFSQALEYLGMDKWEGPVQSGFGLHLVKLERVDTIEITLKNAEVRKQITNDWLNDQRIQAEKKTIESLLDRYTVEFNGP